MTEIDLSQLQALGLLSGQLGELFTVEGVILMLTFSTIGIFYFKRGKKEGDSIKLLCGIALIAYVYFINQLISLIVIGLILVAVPYLHRFFK